MLGLIYDVLWDRAAGRALIAAAIAAGGAFYFQPRDRSVEERLLGALFGATGGAVMAAPSGRSKSVQQELEEMRKRVDAMSGPRA